MVLATLLHEIGHYNGFEHYFAGSNKGTLSSPSDTVMDYTPFANRHLLTDLGERDLKKISAIYRGSPIDDEPICADSDVFGTANCKSMDIGDPAAWLIELARQGKDGVFTKISLAGGMDFTASSDDDVLKAMKNFLLGYRENGIPPAEFDEVIATQFANNPTLALQSTPAQARRVQNFLCAQPNLEKIKQRLKDEWQITILCN